MEQNDSLVVEVEDNGPGIPEEDQGRLFQPYHRQLSDREHLSGLGLGLALCKYIVELHDGEIWVNSKVGKGSTFGFSIPLATTGQQQEGAKREVVT
jgi:signal transduction histidine kinase